MENKNLRDSAGKHLQAYFYLFIIYTYRIIMFQERIAFLKPLQIKRAENKTNLEKDARNFCENF